MAQSGLTGQAIAAQLQDKLSAMQTATDSGRPAKSYASSWGDGIKVMIPNTGISVGDVYRTLAGWLGHQTHITGEVYRTPDRHRDHRAQQWRRRRHRHGLARPISIRCCRRRPRRSTATPSPTAMRSISPGPISTPKRWRFTRHWRRMAIARTSCGPTWVSRRNTNTPSHMPRRARTARRWQSIPISSLLTITSGMKKLRLVILKSRLPNLARRHR